MSAPAPSGARPRAALSLGPSPPSSRHRPVVETLRHLHAQRDEAGVLLAAVHAVERALPGAAAALFQVDPEAQIVSLRAAGPRWRTAERDAPAWLTRETRGLAGFVRGMEASEGCWWRRPDSGYDGGYDIVRVRVVVADRPWGMLVVVGGLQETGRTSDTGCIETLAAQVGLALGNGAARDEPRRLHCPGGRRAPATRTATRLGALVLESLERARPHLGDVNERHDRNIRVRVECDEDSSVDLERDSMRDVLVHLLTNAINASVARGDDIAVWVGREGREAFVAVIDNGAGMDDQTRQHLFERSISTTSRRGAGHGLAVCLGVVERHGGRLAVASTRGVGSTFTVWLPMASAIGQN